MVLDTTRMTSDNERIITIQGGFHVVVTTVIMASDYSELDANGIGSAELR
ncbi:hypothetical protein HMPREF1544_01370 [Mucor circinelloides 1006PhL]|uniref:Uncharacterized protein n=1 Tax=Mucor circinelloides f. circinelloides (strain 1006PhL) TaxID=1220926 RepID=S2JNH2_MUCC1|nr:hypothetical protein HMPREF1544_01370 [Mucor circinelloides 1006PhL]